PSDDIRHITNDLAGDRRLVARRTGPLAPRKRGIRFGWGRVRVRPVLDEEELAGPLPPCFPGFGVQCRGGGRGVLQSPPVSQRPGANNGKPGRRKGSGGSGYRRRRRALSLGDERHVEFHPPERRDRGGTGRRPPSLRGEGRRRLSPVRRPAAVRFHGRRERGRGPGGIVRRRERSPRSRLGRLEEPRRRESERLAGREATTARDRRQVRSVAMLRSFATRNVHRLLMANRRAAPLPPPLFSVGRPGSVLHLVEAHAPAASHAGLLPPGHAVRRHDPPSQGVAGQRDEGAVRFQIRPIAGEVDVDPTTTPAVAPPRVVL
ncbi:hypothetical protein ACHAWF_015130, partial [Thalassiosira exigua]